ncbi:MAG: hypothetical protein J0L75_06910 [Spirochaetes bacterium]|nr:hypothetical protein [Spirochaetota bacterium]
MSLSESTKAKLKIAKERHGVSPELLARVKETNRIHRAILEAVATEAKSVPDIAAATSLPSEVVFWNVNALRKYNKLVDVKKSGDFWLYQKK